MRRRWRHTSDGQDRAITTERRLRRRLAATLALIVAIAVAIAIVLGIQSSGSPSKASGNPTASGATTVQRRDLVETDTESGTLSYANTYTVYNRLSGTITSLPAVGQVIKPGQALYRVGNVPVILMDGSTPAYRDLNSSDSDGPDILELNRNLVKLGFNQGGIVIDDQWQAATTDGVDLFQASLGESETGDLTLGQVVFLPGDQLVSSVSATLGSDGGSAASYRPPAGGPGSEFVSLTKSTPGAGPSPSSGSPSSGSPSSGSPSGSGKPCPSGKSGKAGKTRSKRKSCKPPTSAQTLAALEALLRAEAAELQAEAHNHGNPSGSGSGNPSGSGSGHPSGSGSGNPSGSGSGNPSGSGSGNGSGNGNGSGGGGGATAVMQTSSTQLVVTVDLDATKQSEAKVGEPVTVELPNGNTVDGRVSAVSPVAQSSSGNGNGNGNGGGGGSGGGGNGSGSSSGAVIPVTVRLSGHQAGAGLDQAAVSVNFAEAQANNVLSVPVTALLAVSGGSYDVQEVAPPHTLIPVTTGLFAAGYVEISGPGIYAGLQVTDSQG